MPGQVVEQQQLTMSQLEPHLGGIGVLNVTAHDHVSRAISRRQAGVYACLSCWGNAFRLLDVNDNKAQFWPAGGRAQGEGFTDGNGPS